MIIDEGQQLIKTIILNQYPQQYSSLKPWNIQSQHLTLKQKIFNSKLFINQKHQYNHWTVKKILDLINITNKNHNFIPIVAFNTEIINGYIFISKILTPFCVITLKELIYMLKTNNLSLFMGQAQRLWHQYKDILVHYRQHCYEFSLIKCLDKYRIVIEFNFLQFAQQQQESESSTYSFHLNQRLQYLKQYTSSLSDKSSLLPDLQMCQIYQTLSQQIDNQLKQHHNSNQDYLLYNYDIINILYSNFIHNLYDFIHTTIQGLTTIIYNKKKHNNQYYKQEIISMIDPTTNEVHNGDIYHNLGCEHYQGITYEAYSTMKSCPFCNGKLYFDQEYVQIYCHNIFQNMIMYNYLNQNDHKYILYNFNTKSFLPSNDLSVLNNNSFYNGATFRDYNSFKVYIQRNHRLDIKSRSLYHQYETISLYNKLNGKKTSFKSYELMDCPVRGKYCKHWQCYDLIKVYKQMIKKGSKDEFQCFICCKNIRYEQIIYLYEVKMIVEFIKDNFYRHLEERLEVKLMFNHQEQGIVVYVKRQGQVGNVDKLELDVYETFRDSRRKSRFIPNFYEERNIVIRDEFKYFFYGL